MRNFTKKEELYIGKIIDRIRMGISELSAMIIHAYAPTLWLDFLNSDPEKSEEMWGVYYGFVRFMETIQDEYCCSKDIMDMELMSKMEFLETYPAKLQDNAQRLHGGIKRVMDERRGDIVNRLVGHIGAEEKKKKTPEQEKEIDKATKEFTGGVIIPPVSFTVSIQLPEEENPPQLTYDANIHTASAQHRNFWLAIILDGAMTLSSRDGEIIVRRCAAPDCRKYFARTTYRQIYHSLTCSSRHRMQKRRCRQKKI